MKKSERKGERKRTQQATRRRKRNAFIQKKWTGCIDTIHNSIYIYIYFIAKYIRLKKKNKKRIRCVHAHPFFRNLVKLRGKSKKKKKKKTEKEEEEEEKREVKEEEEKDEEERKREEKSKRLESRKEKERRERDRGRSSAKRKWPRAVPSGVVREISWWMVLLRSSRSSSFFDVSPTPRSRNHLRARGKWSTQHGVQVKKHARTMSPW